MTATRRGRPLGELSAAVFRAVQERPRTVRQIATDLRMPVSMASWRAAQLVRTGWLSYSDQVVVTATRPARVLVPAAQGGAPQPSAVLDLADAIARIVRGGR